MSSIDLKVFNELKDATGADFIGELVQAFLEDAPSQIAQMQSALTGQDAESFRRAAHTLKSNAATFGATDLSGLARELEMLGREKNLEVGNRLQVLEEAFDQVKNQLNELIR
ncbi:MAG: Hpt domain-containing protein [Anaerolineales bacterium]|nr:Hpt domain-containing protein [Anaerolineales bacterium]